MANLSSFVGPGMTSHRTGRRLLATVLAAVTAATVGAFAGAGPAAAAAAPAVPDPERYSVTDTGWGWFMSADKATINNWATQHNMRITGIEVDTPTTFTAVLVHNTGPYQRGLSGANSWTTGETPSTISTKVASGRRVLDLERYTENGQTRFAAVWVDNPATNFHDSKIYYNGTIDEINAWVAQHNGRLIDVDFVSAGRYDAVLVKNDGVDYQQWHWLPEATTSQISDESVSNDSRVVDIEPVGNNKFSVLFVRNDSSVNFWSWAPSLSFQQLIDLQKSQGRRPIHVKGYWQNGEYRYAASFIERKSGAHAEAWQAMRNVAGGAGFGFYLKRIDGAVIENFREKSVFEPASMVKALHHLHALSEVRDGGITLNTAVTYFRHPDAPMDGGRCAYTDAGMPITTSPVTESLSTVLWRTMNNSDNRTTDALYNRYGRNTLNATAASLGMTKTTINHRIGCTWNAPMQVAASNETTLADIGRLYEAVYRANNPVLGTGIERAQFGNLMAGNSDSFISVVQDEAAKLGKSSTVAQDFLSAMIVKSKAGGYRNGFAGCAADGCTHETIRAGSGVYVALPVKGYRGAIEFRQYVMGAYFDGTFDCGPNDTKLCTEEEALLGPARGDAYRAILRAQIRSALLTW